MKKIALVMTLYCASAALPLDGFAQSGFGGGGGNSGGGGSGLGGSGTGLGGLGGGLGGAGGGLGGTSGLGQNTGLGGLGGQQQGQLGQQGQQGFLGRTPAEQGFLGANTQTQQGQMGNRQQSGGNRRAGGNRNGNPMNMANQLQQMGNGNQTSSGSQLPPIRPRQTLGFVYTTPSIKIVSANLGTRIIKKPGLENVNLSVDPSGELVLKGEVASIEKAKLAENLVRLEPGVLKIRNELTYPPQPSDEQSP